jgi:hypothetical protein
MSKIACAALLIAISLQAQVGRVAETAAGTNAAVVVQRTSPSTPPGTPQGPRLIDNQATGYLRAPAPNCVIPLQRFPVDGKEHYSMKTMPANPAIDPKIVAAPRLPVCWVSRAPQKSAPPQPSTGTK